MYSDFLLAISCIALAVAVILLERRVSALEKPFIPEIDEESLKRSMALHQFAEKVFSQSSKFEEKCKELFSRPCAEDESADFRDRDYIEK